MSRQDVEERDLLAAYGFLRFADHGDLRVYSYTDRCYRMSFWNELTLNSRGIIFDRLTGECVARPFPKFFNLDELPGLDEASLPWDEVVQLCEKLDGWLGIHYRHAGLHCIATRGSFSTEAGLWATGELQRFDLVALPDEVTLCFEIVHPLTRVVVDYGERAEIVLLAAFNRHTGEEYAAEQVRDWADAFEFATPWTLSAPATPARIAGLLEACVRNGGEGFVARFSDGRRVKIKTADYVQRFRLWRAERRTADSGWTSAHADPGRV